MDDSNFDQLPFWHFFYHLEKELGYERWIEKYKLFLEGVLNLSASSKIEGVIEGGFEKEFRQFCKFLYLQDHKDEERFDKVLSNAIQREKQAWITVYEKFQDSESEIDRYSRLMGDLKNEEDNNQFTGTENKQTIKEKNDPNPLIQKDPKFIQSRKEKLESVYFNYQFSHKPVYSAGDEKEVVVPLFLEGDEYFPLTRREMIKSWQYLRSKKQEGFQNQLDIPALVKKIASEGGLTTPVFKPKYTNLQDTIIILADTRGSMTPFENLTDRLIETARMGGHGKAKVYFFQNFPKGYVFEKRNLSSPIRLSNAFRLTKFGTTYAIIISDAGAARGNTDPDLVNQRIENTRQFLSVLQQHTSNIIWLNPMPTHRWQGTAAESIAYPNNELEVLPAPNVMLSVFDDNSFHFQTALYLSRVSKK